MLRSLCCFCFSSENSGNERQPLLQQRSSDPDAAESARKTLPARKQSQSVKRTGRLVVRRVCVPELDKRFSDMAESFNEQQECYEAMAQHISALQQSYDCAHDDPLAFSECLGKIREEHGTYRVSLMVKGYDFFLSVVPMGLALESQEKTLPPRLQFAQDELRGISESAKATISKGTTLQELIGWLLRGRDQMTKQVKEAAPSYQELGRLNENLEENIKEVKRAKDLSLKYRQQAGGVFIEAAQIAGAFL